MVRYLRETGVTIILTTHYIEEAEEMADRVGVMSFGKLILVEDKMELMKKLGRKQLILTLVDPIYELPEKLIHLPLELSDEGQELIYTFNSQSSETGISSLLKSLDEEGLRLKDLRTVESSLEDIFIGLIEGTHEFS